MEREEDTRILAAAWPGIGLHEDVPAAVYHAMDAASSHRLRTLARSPLHCRHELDNPSDPTPAMVFGEAVHYACLQPHLFAGRYGVSPKCDRRTKDGKATYEAFRADLGDRLPITAEDAAACIAMSAAIEAHPTAGMLLGCNGPIEVSGVWRDDATGQLCKLRADKLAETRADGEAVAAIVDLKTTDDAGPDGFERSILRYGYHVQAAMYLRGMAALGRPFEHFVFVCVEKDPPHAVGVYRLDDEAVEAGDARLDELLEEYADCAKSGRWPGYASTVQTISLPGWFLKQTNTLTSGRIG